MPNNATTRMLQNFRLVWLDGNYNESIEDFRRSIKHLRNVVASITLFKEIKECLNFLRDIRNEKVFMITSGKLGQIIVPEIESWPQLEFIYIFCVNKSYHEEWARNISKIKGVYTQIRLICESLQVDTKKCDKAMISMSFNGIDRSFMYTQLLKEALLQINDEEDGNTNAIQRLADYCREQGDINEEHITTFEKEYHSHSPIWWYTAPSFLYSMLNRGLRQMDIDIILHMQFFLRHLHNQIAKLYREQQSTKKNSKPFTLYRGQKLPRENFEKLKQTNGKFMSFNNFLSTSSKPEIALTKFVEAATTGNQNDVGIFFVLNIDPEICIQYNIPYADVTQTSYFEDSEAEILFTTHTIFRINKIEPLNHKDNINQLWTVKLTLTGYDENDLENLTITLRHELGCTTGWSRVGDIFVTIGEYEKAEQLYQILLKKAFSAQDQGNYYNRLGIVYYNKGEYSKAISYLEKALTTRRMILPKNHPDIAHSCNKLGLVYTKIGAYDKSLSMYLLALEIIRVARRTDHPDLAESYDNIGEVYRNLGQYSEALSYYEQSLNIKKASFPENHPSLAASYNNIGLVYDHMGKHSIAFSYYEKDLEISHRVLPPNHPDLAASYNNIGTVCYNMGKYREALSNYKKAVEINQITYGSNHPSLATSYNNIGEVYRVLGEYTKALSYFQKDLEMVEKCLPEHHQDLASSYNNIGLVYHSMGEYVKALQSCEKARQILAKSFSDDHPNMVKVNRTIDNLKEKLSSTYSVDNIFTKL